MQSVREPRTDGATTTRGVEQAERSSQPYAMWWRVLHDRNPRWLLLVFDHGCGDHFAEDFARAAERFVGGDDHAGALTSVRAASPAVPLLSINDYGLMIAPVSAYVLLTHATGTFVRTGP
jgi:hypothetical protein